MTLHQCADTALEKWTREHGDAAAAEGWGVMECCGSIYGPVQIQRIDHDEENDILQDDESAWKLVIIGTQPQHIEARALMRKYHAKEWQSVCHHASKRYEWMKEKNPKLNPEVIAELLAARMMPDPYGD